MLRDKKTGNAVYLFLFKFYDGIQLENWNECR